MNTINLCRENIWTSELKAEIDDRSKQWEADKSQGIRFSEVQKNVQEVLFSRNPNKKLKE